VVAPALRHRKEVCLAVGRELGLLWLGLGECMGYRVGGVWWGRGGGGFLNSMQETQRTATHTPPIVNAARSYTPHRECSAFIHPP
jgi:hypothetical protein